MKVKFSPDIKMITRTALLLALTLVVQSFRFPPFVTGPLVNFMLILSTIMVGTAGGVFIGFLTPWAALLVGILPAPLAPVVPFIMFGNAFYCLLYGWLGGAGGRKWLGIGVASFAKFAVIGSAAQFILALPAPLVQILLFPQLLNALIGGVFAIGVGHHLKKVLA